MLGRFLEISLRTSAIQDSLAFYEALGFLQAPVGETWPHPYAVVTDGRLFLGLHQAPIPAPSLTFVLPRLATGVQRLQHAGIDFDQLCLGEDAFNQATFHDPNGQAVMLLEARTFSPPALDAPSSCGYFAEYGLPTRAVATSREFWESLGFVALEEEPEPLRRTPLTSRHINVALYCNRLLRQPLLTFEDRNMRQRLIHLRRQGLHIGDEIPDDMDTAANGMLVAPEGTHLLLLQAGD